MLSLYMPNTHFPYSTPVLEWGECSARDPATIEQVDLVEGLHWFRQISPQLFSSPASSYPYRVATQARLSQSLILESDYCETLMHTYRLKKRTELPFFIENMFHASFH